MFSRLSKFCVQTAVSRSFEKGLKSATLKHLHLAQKNAVCSSQLYQKNWIHTSQVTMKDSISFNVQDDEDFTDRVMDAKGPIIVDFHAEWCGPCRLLGPRIETEVDKHNGKVRLAKIDVDDLPELAMKYKVNVLPSVLLIKDGKEVDRFQGNVDDDLLTHFIKKEL